MLRDKLRVSLSRISLPLGRVLKSKKRNHSCILHFPGKLFLYIEPLRNVDCCDCCTKKKKVFKSYIVRSPPKLVQEIARFLGLFGINTVSDISKFTKISFTKIYSQYLFKIPRRNCAVSFLYRQGKEISHFTQTAVIFTCKYYKFGLNTTGLSQSHFRNLSALSIKKTHIIFVSSKLCSDNFCVYALNFTKHYKFGSIEFHLQRLNSVP